MGALLLTSRQMRDCEARAGALGVSTAQLMDRAGRSVAELATQMLPDATAPVLVLVGPGNNGGDGLVGARYLRESGLDVGCYVWRRTSEDDAVGVAAAQAGVTLWQAADDPDGNQLRLAVQRAGLIVDALLGTGLSRPLGEDLRQLLRLVGAERGRRRVLAVDVPTGLDADSGAVDEATLAADTTLALGHYKPGLLLAPGSHCVGRLQLGEIGLPVGLRCEGLGEVLDDAGVARLLPARPVGSHKGTYGKVLVVAGSTNYVGAAALACQAAYRAGAGLVTLATPHSVYKLLAARLTETTFLPLREETPGTLGPAALPELCVALADYDALLVGPGLGRHAGTVEAVRALCQELAARAPERRPLVVLDADALNALAARDGWWLGLGPRAVITPHPGEMARLLDLDVEQVERRRLALAGEAADRWALTVILKGAHTLVADPAGGLAVSPIATPALATAGSGDVLAGALAGLAAQGLGAEAAARGAVYLHGRAGEALEAQWGEAGGIASDLLALLPSVQRRLRGVPRPE
ncbi:MAG: NAD(P)H-hydrate dehydratase [Chloroflexota bacterium]